MVAPLFPTASGPPTYQHDPDADLDYGWDFSSLIVPTDIIASAEFVLEMGKPGGTVATGITLTLGDIVNTLANGSDPQVAIVYGWLAVQDLALLGKTVAGTCRYTSAQGRTDDRSMLFTIKEW